MGTYRIKNIGRPEETFKIPDINQPFMRGGQVQMIKPGGELIEYDITSIFTPEEKQSIGAYGAQVAEAKKRLGLKLPTYDVIPTGAWEQLGVRATPGQGFIGSKGQISELQSLLKTPPATTPSGDVAWSGADVLAKEKAMRAQGKLLIGGEWVTPTAEQTGVGFPVGVGTPRPIGQQALTGQQIPFKEGLNEQQKQGIIKLTQKPSSDWTKTDIENWNYATGGAEMPQDATLTSPTGEKKKVVVGSPEASQLLSSGWTLRDKLGGGTITGEALAEVSPVEVEKQQAINGSLADQTVASIETDLEAMTKANKELLEAPESDLSRRVEDLLGGAEIAAGELTGRGEMQISEEEKRQIEQQQIVINDKTTELNKKLAEIKALTASYQLENQMEEGRPQTLARLQGAQAQNYKMYLAQKNLLVSEASYMQAELLGLQGKLDSAQAAADRAVDLEYQDREADYNAKLNQLNILLPQLNKEETRYAEAVKMALQQQANALAEQKAEKKAELSRDMSMLSKGYTYVRTPLERDNLRDKGYEILEIGGRTYAKAGEPIKVSGGVSGKIEEPLSINQIDQFRRAYGWTPPYGFTESQLLKYMEDNPNATPEELEAGAKQAIGETSAISTTQYLSKEYLRENFSEDELKTMSDNFGTSKWYTGKTSDINRFLNEKKKKIETARNEGYSDDEILEFIKEYA